MKSRIRPAYIVLVLAALTGLACTPMPTGTRDYLAKAEHVEICALDPMATAMREGESAPEADATGELKVGESFHGYEILGRAKLTDADERRSLLGLVQDAIRKSDGTVAACFNPRHGVRAVHDGKTVDFVICFECNSMYIYGPDEARESHPIARSPEPDMTRLFKRHNLSIDSGQ